MFKQREKLSYYAATNSEMVMCFKDPAQSEKPMKKAQLLIIPWLILLAGCTTAINLNRHASEGMTANFKQHSYQRKFQIVCGYGLRNYVYNGRPSGLTGSETTSSINIGETFCALLGQANAMVQPVTGESDEIILDLKSINFDYSYEGTAIWAEKGRDFDTAFILIKLVAESGSKTREYTFIVEKEKSDSTGESNSVKYTVVNSALEEIIYQLYEKLYMDFD